jgi:sulfonate transport system substrate-binding protein
VKWVEFPAGPPMIAAMGKDEVDLGFTGGVPAVFGQAQDIPLVYVAGGPPAPKFSGILVRQDSTIKTLADLKGKKIAATKASIAYYLLFQALREGGLALEEIQFVDVPPPKGLEALRKGEVDAWVCWYPFLAQLQETMPVRLLTDGEGLISDRVYYVATRSFVNHHFDLIPILMEEMRSAGIWANNNQEKVAQIIAPNLKQEKSVALKTIASRTNGAAQIQDRAIEEQQRIADTFFRLGILPKQIRVEDAVWKGKLSN